MCVCVCVCVCVCPSTARFACSSQPPPRTTRPKCASTPLRTPRHPTTATLLVDVHGILVAVPSTQLRAPLPRALLVTGLHLNRPLLLPPQLLPLDGIPLHLVSLGFQMRQCGVAALGPRVQRGLQGGERAGRQVAQRGNGSHRDERVCGVEGGGQQAGVDGGCDELFEGAGSGQVEGGEQVVVGEGGVGVGEGEEREEEQLLVLLG